MKTVIDTCTLINLVNSGCLSHICSLSALDLCVGDIVFDECETIKQALVTMQDRGSLKKINSDDIPVDAFAKLIESFGEGEAECIAIGDHLGYRICTDDGKARKYVISKYGSDRLIGSIGLIKQCYVQGLKSQEQAFLPHFAEAEFEKLLNSNPSEHV